MNADWRLTTQEEYLGAASFVRKPYSAWTETWDHDHCEFCWAKFMEAGSPAVEPHPPHDSALTEGYAAIGTGPKGENDYHWVCETCFEDFRERFGWVVSSPAA
ncbi:MAG: hypothetical protein QOH73_191 [Gaiellaceae bacterium]|jgi:hypothetical protein|nr:hypothetical protein [Gaiellaceae bacterium]